MDQTLLSWHPSYTINSQLQTKYVNYNPDIIQNQIDMLTKSANKLPKNWPYFSKPFDYNIPNEYNNWNDLTSNYFNCINPYFPFPTPLFLPYGYVINTMKINGKKITGIQYCMPWAYNNWNTFVYDLSHKLGCYIMYNSKYSMEIVKGIFQNKPLPTPMYLESIKSQIKDSMPIWEYDDGMNKFVVDIFLYKKDQYGQLLSP